MVREEFGKGNDFATKITYRATGEKAEDLIAAFRNCYNPRIAVTVDMIATGTDVKPLECVFFMRSPTSCRESYQPSARLTATKQRDSGVPSKNPTLTPTFPLGAIRAEESLL